MAIEKHSVNDTDTTVYFIKTNIDIIDKQHSRIDGIFDKLIKTKFSDVNYDDIFLDWDKLDKLMREHFDTEENLMREAGFQEIEKHLQQHAAFLNMLDEFRNSGMVKSNYLKKMNYEFALSLFKNWFVVHSRAFDSLYVESVKNYLNTMQTR